MRIPDEAVEAAARWLWERDSNDIVQGPTPTWDKASDLPMWRSSRDDYRQEARELLESTAPHLLADAWEAGCQEGLSYNPGYDEEALAQNPYRSAGAGE